MAEILAFLNCILIFVLIGGFIWILTLQRNLHTLQDQMNRLMQAITTLQEGGLQQSQQSSIVEASLESTLQPARTEDQPSAMPQPDADLPVKQSFLKGISPSDEPEPVEEPTLEVEREPSWLVKWLTRTNLLVQIAIVVLFFGVAIGPMPWPSRVVAWVSSISPHSPPSVSMN